MKIVEDAKSYIIESFHRCVICKEELEISKYSKIQQNKAKKIKNRLKKVREQAQNELDEEHLKRLEDSIKIRYGPTCLECTSKNRTHLTCLMCGKKMSLSKFSKNQRIHNDRARCLECMKERDNENNYFVTDSEDEDLSDDLYFGAASPVAFCAQSQFDERSDKSIPYQYDPLDRSLDAPDSLSIDSLKIDEFRESKLNQKIDDTDSTIIQSSSKSSKYTNFESIFDDSDDDATKTKQPLNSKSNQRNLPNHSNHSNHSNHFSRKQRTPIGPPPHRHQMNFISNQYYNSHSDRDYYYQDFHSEPYRSDGLNVGLTQYHKEVNPRINDHYMPHSKKSSIRQGSEHSYNSRCDFIHDPQAEKTLYEHSPFHHYNDQRCIKSRTNCEKGPYNAVPSYHFDVSRQDSLYPPYNQVKLQKNIEYNSQNTSTRQKGFEYNESKSVYSAKSSNSKMFTNHYNDY